MLAFFQEYFQGGSIVMQISFVVLIFLLFSDQISGGKRPTPPAILWKKASMNFRTFKVCGKLWQVLF